VLIHNFMNEGVATHLSGFNFMNEVGFPKAGLLESCLGMQLRPRTNVVYSELSELLIHNIPSQETLNQDNENTHIQIAKHKCMGLGCFAGINFKRGDYIAAYPGLLRDESQLLAHQSTRKEGASVRVLVLQVDTSVVQSRRSITICAIDGTKKCNATYINCTLNTEVSLDLC
jgi:hypothetical protein